MLLEETCLQDRASGPPWRKGLQGEEERGSLISKPRSDFWRQLQVNWVQFRFTQEAEEECEKTTELEDRHGGDRNGNR